MHMLESPDHREHRQHLRRRYSASRGYFRQFGPSLGEHQDVLQNSRPVCSWNNTLICAATVFMTCPETIETLGARFASVDDDGDSARRRGRVISRQ